MARLRSNRSLDAGRTGKAPEAVRETLATPCRCVLVNSDVRPPRQGHGYTEEGT